MKYHCIPVESAHHLSPLVQGYGKFKEHYENIMSGDALVPGTAWASASTLMTSLMAQCKKDVTPVRWSYIFLALTHWSDICYLMTIWGWFNIKMLSYQYKKSHCGDKMILWSTYLQNGISYTGKTSLYWIRALVQGLFEHEFQTRILDKWGGMIQNIHHVKC